MESTSVSWRSVKFFCWVGIVGGYLLAAWMYQVWVNDDTATPPLWKMLLPLALSIGASGTAAWMLTQRARRYRFAQTVVWAILLSTIMSYLLVFFDMVYLQG